MCSMRPKEILVLGDGDAEVLDFLERARSVGPLRVKIGDDVFLVKVTPDSVSPSARAFLTGPKKADGG